MDPVIRNAQLRDEAGVVDIAVEGSHVAEVVAGHDLEREFGLI